MMTENCFELFCCNVHLCSYVSNFTQVNSAVPGQEAPAVCLRVGSCLDCRSLDLLVLWPGDVASGLVIWSF